jgi:hypothetical protein
MKRTIIPSSTTDRILVAVSLLSGIIATWLYFINPGDRLTFAGWAAAVTGLVLAYVLQDRGKPGPNETDYTTVIGTITGIVSELGKLNAFLERERSRVTDTEATLQRLHSEKAELEPVVLTHRETVDAILRAHSDRTAKNVWKERLLGFFFGVVSSLAASFVYDYLRR